MPLTIRPPTQDEISTALGSEGAIPLPTILVNTLIASVVFLGPLRHFFPETGLIEQLLIWGAVSLIVTGKVTFYSFRRRGVKRLITIENKFGPKTKHEVQRRVRNSLLNSGSSKASFDFDYKEIAVEMGEASTETEASLTP